MYCDMAFRLLVFGIMCIRSFSVYARDHLVVLSHGLHGTRTDLTYLAQRLENAGIKTLRSYGNEYFESHHGIREGAVRLAKEVLDFTQADPTLTKISFVGNSLGGLYGRYAVKELYDNATGLVAGLTPVSFMTIATPHLGVRNFTLFDEYNIRIHDAVKNSLANLIGLTGQDLYLHDPNVLGEGSLVYRMSTAEEFLAPLRAFQRKRLYANLGQDLMVPLGTAAFLSPEEVRELRAKLAHSTGVVHTIRTDTSGGDAVEEERECVVLESGSDGEMGGKCESVGAGAEASSCGTSAAPPTDTDLLPVERMRRALDSTGWEKVIVSFKGLYGFLPMAHNQIAAVAKFGTLVDGLLGFHEGRHVMEHAADWLVGS